MDGDELRLTMPAAGPYTRLARVAVTGLATRLGFSFDEVEDLRVAVADVCTKLIGLVPDAERLEVRFLVGDGSLSIDVAVSDLNGSDPGDVDRIIAELRDANVDGIEHLEGRPAIRVAKTHVEDDGDDDD